MSDSAISGLIFNVMRFATHDGPGIRTTVFLKGCPLSCDWCHNPESQNFRPDRLYFEERCRHCLDCAGRCPEHAIEVVDGAPRTSNACTLCGECTEVCVAEARQLAGRRYSVAELIAEVEKDVIFFEESGGGVTLSGGEPASQPAFAEAFLGECRAKGLSTAIETCGFAQPDTFRRIAHRAGLVLFDLKLVDTEKHARHTGVPNATILTNLRDLIANGHPTTVRIPFVPGVNDSPQDIADFTGFLANLRPPAVEILPYHPAGVEKYRRLGRTYPLHETPKPAPADLATFQQTLTRAGLRVTVGV